MKFNWGTGIFLFLVLFLIGSAVFIFFASRQTVNLVHKDYYEKGVDYSEEMEVQKRSRAFANALETHLTDAGLEVTISDEVARHIDSGTLMMYRPSDSRKDLTIEVNAGENTVIFKRADLINGRYILKLTWLADDVKYEIERPVNIQ